MAKDVTLLIKLNDQASGKIRKITNSTRQLERAANGAQNSIRRTNKGIRDTGREAARASTGVNKLGSAIRGLAAGFGIFQAGKFVIFKTAELERQTKSLQVLTGSLGNARNIVKELQQFGAVTPFTSTELIETAKRLKAFGFETQQVVNITKRLADVAGATGADLGGIATAFGQIQAKGRLQGEELLQLQERGVDLQGTLRKEYGLTADEFQKALSQGRIGADAVNFALEKLTETGGKYAGGAIAQSDTLAGKFSTLVDGVENIARSVGEVLEPAIKGVLGIAINAVNSINALFNAQKRLSGFGIGDELRNKLFKQATEEATQIALLRGGGVLDPAEFDRIKQQRFSDLINQFGFETGQLIPETTAPSGSKERPDLGGGNGNGNGTKGRVDASKELVALNERLFASAKPLSELEKINLAYQIEKQQILDQDLGANQEKIRLLEAAAGFEQDLIGYRNEQIELQDKANKKAEAERKKLEEAEKKRREADPGFQMKKQLEELLDVQNQVAAGATAIGNAFANSFKSVITGTKSAEQALADMMSAVAEHFLDMAAKIIAQQIAMILYGTIMKSLGLTPGGGMGGENYFDPITGKGVAGPNFGLAEGGYVSGPTNALIGEGGEPEYVIPESKMRESMARYSRGARGGSVIPENGEGGTNAEGGEGSVSAPIDVRFNVERINSVDYVTAEEFQVGMTRAAQQGAAEGERRAIGSMRNSPAVRRRIGV
ncbi:MAG: hypothetical protein DWQ28_08000 [Proteobacteria bacterium]|nr:MAG: hypothetical protein DWQ28_08000 [Pseudomonadota bacterium]